MNAKAVVLKEIPLKEEDKIIIAFSKEYGKISIYAKGARKTKSAFLAGTQVLTYSNFYIHKKENLSNVLKIDLVDSYLYIKNDIEKLYYALYFCEFIDHLIIEENPQKDLFGFFIFTLEYMQHKLDLRLIKVIFEIKILSLCGFIPDVERCTGCGKLLDEAYFDEENKVLLCPDCAEKKGLRKITKTTLFTLKYIMRSELGKVFHFTLDEPYLNELSFIGNRFKNEVIEKTLNTEKFLT